MRGLLKAGLLLAPALASAFVVPEINPSDLWTKEQIDDAVKEEGSKPGESHEAPP